MMWNKEQVLNDSYLELSDCLLDLLRYEFIGVDLGNYTIPMVNHLLENTQEMVDNPDDYEWSDVMKVRQSNYTVIRMINTLLINQYDKIFSHKTE